MTIRILLLLMLFSASTFAQTPQIDPGVSQELAQWRAVRYSNVRYKLNLTLEKMSPVLKGTMEIRVVVNKAAPGSASANILQVDGVPVAGATVLPLPLTDVPIILDWRKIRGHEEKSTISNVSINGRSADTLVRMSVASTRTGTGDDQSSNGKDILAGGTGDADKSVRAPFEERDEHLIFSDGVVMGENVIKLDFTSPILPSGSAITRYVDKEDGSEYLYSLFVPSDASTAFPVFDQPDIKARFELSVDAPSGWAVVSNERKYETNQIVPFTSPPKEHRAVHSFNESKPFSTYVFAFAAGPFEGFVERDRRQVIDEILREKGGLVETDYNNPRHVTEAEIEARIISVYLRKSQAAKFKPHAAEVFRLNREAIKYFEEYFDYKFPFPKYDLVLIPEFPFGGMEHAGATFLREASIIFPQEPTKNDLVSRATLIFHETAHQWFGDTVTMRWFDDLWLKEGFATFTAYKALEKIMPEMNAWKVFYERVKQAAYQTDSTRGTTAIYQPIANLSAAKSAYGNIVYNKAPAFLRQAEFYLGEDKFQTAVRSFLKKHEYANAGWEDLVNEFSAASQQNMSAWANVWVKQSGLPTFRICIGDYSRSVKYTGHPGEINMLFSQTGFPCYPPTNRSSSAPIWPEALQFYYVLADGKSRNEKIVLAKNDSEIEQIWGYSFGGRESNQAKKELAAPKFVHTNYHDYGYGIFLLDAKSRDYVLKNIQNEKDPFLRSMMWGALWDSVREGELDPREYVRLVVTVLGSPAYRRPPQDDESTIAMLLSRVGTAMSYYIPLSPAEPVTPTTSSKVPTTVGSNDIQSSVETMLLGEIQREGSSLGRRLTFYRALLNLAASENARAYLKQILAGDTKGRVDEIPLKTKDRFDIVTKLLILNDPEAPKLLAGLEKTETADDAKRYAYAARAGIPTAENKAKYWNDFVNNKEISESWIEAAFGPWNSIRHSDLTLPYLERALKELPNHKRNRKIFFVNGWLGAFIGGQRSEEALAIVNKFLADNPKLDNDLRLKILENVDVIERAVRIRKRY